MSSTNTCPKCGKPGAVAESRRRHPKSAVTVGAWRIPYGLISGAAVMILGLLAFYASQSLGDVLLSQLTLALAALSLIFAVFILGSTFYITRWIKTEEIHCNKCGHRWPIQ